ncbi:hypothetical protein ACL2XP_17880 [Sodalis sp. RH21]|uniref:hypothetical protein n=1 Tax=unclassified Sodalis (in: enterobacteria) TaxID=2636512 RepID=UPI0039B681D9
MDDINYPHDYLPLPVTDGYGFEPVAEQVLRSQLSSGRARQRQIYISVPSQVQVKWMFKKPGQAQLFEAWYKFRVKGAAWFQMRLLTPLGVDSYQCRFTGMYQGPTLLLPRRWQCTATLELWQRPVIDEELLDFPDIVVNQDILDLSINREWPKS